MYFLGYDISGIVFTLKVIGFLFSVGFSVGIVVYLLGKLKLHQKKRDRFENHFITPVSEKTYEEKRWENIKAHFQSSNPAQWRMAIIDADSLLEEIITDLGYTGESFGEKLKSMNYDTFPLLDEAWTVHKLRNTIAHQGSHYHLSEREVFQTFKLYEQIFYKTGYIS